MMMLCRALAGVTRVGTGPGGVAIALMMVRVSLDVRCRYAVKSPLRGTLTIVICYYMNIATFVPLAYAEHRRAHISVEVAIELMPARVRHHLQGWMYLATAAVMVVLTRRTWGEALKNRDLGASQVQGSATIPGWPAYFALPILLPPCR
jgi:TRAP-type C4-dicarboxylate transport system permease small subunit